MGHQPPSRSATPSDEGMKRRGGMRSHRNLLAALILLYLLVFALTGLAISLFDSPIRG